MGIVSPSFRQFNAGFAILVKASVFQTDKTGSIPVTRSKYGAFAWS